jgi:hypothetical protein
MRIYNSFSYSQLTSLLPLLLSLLPLYVSGFPTGDHIESIEPSNGWYWGSVDANIDWCERNYEVTPYVAEFWNAISSIPIALCAAVGYFAGKRYAAAETR